MKKEITATGVVWISDIGILNVDNRSFFNEAIERLCKDLEISDSHSFAGRVTITIEDLTEEMRINDVV